MAHHRIRSSKPSVGGLKESGTEALELVIDYVKQETLEPLKGLGRYMVFGIVGSVALAVGLVVLAVALLRLLQGETGSTFNGNWSWAPYLLTLVAVVAVAVMAALAVGRGQKRTTSRQSKEDR
ncbi:MAG: phage holin family protein [Acidimicrobiales bacterium]